MTLRDRVVASVKDSFFSGRLKPGDRIVERQIAQKMKVGTPAVREALIALQEQGFVRRVTNSATYVTKYDVDEVEKMYTLRAEFELLALRWAKPRHTEEDLHKLEQIVREMIGAADTMNSRKFYELDMLFHRTCWQLCGNSHLVDALERILPPLFAFVLIASDLVPSRQIATEHYAIIDALRNLAEPEFSETIRRTLGGFAVRGVTSVATDGSAG